MNAALGKAGAISKALWADDAHRGFKQCAWVPKFRFPIAFRSRVDMSERHGPSKHKPTYANRRVSDQGDIVIKFKVARQNGKARQAGRCGNVGPQSFEKWWKCWEARTERRSHAWPHAGFREFART